MASSPLSARPTAVLFDAYGTLFDVYSVGLMAEQLFPGQGARLAQVWRDKQIDYTRILTMSGRYKPFWELTRAGLRFAAQALKLDLSTSAEERLMNQYRSLSAFPENLDVLRSLQDAGIPTGILSNGDPDMLSVAVKSAGMTELLDHVISVEEAQRFKTDRAAYALGPIAMKRHPHEILFVSSNGWDAVGATWYGFTTLWVNRSGGPLECLDTEPTHRGSSLRDVLTVLGLPQPAAD